MPNKKGFTLLEVLIATAILGACLLAVVTVLCGQYYIISQNRERTVATLAAQEVIENIRGMPFDTITASGKVFPNPSGFQYLKNPSLSVRIDNFFSDMTNSIRRVSVVVSWVSMKGTTMQRSLVTVMTKNGVNKQ